MLRLTRIYNGPEATVGVLSVDGFPRFFTLEPPWRNNERNVSCIPVGKYWLQRLLHEKFGLTYILSGVPDRSEIYIHTGNYPHETQGCIIIGNMADVSLQKPCVLESHSAINRLRTLMKERDEIEIFDIAAPDEPEEVINGHSPG